MENIKTDEFGFKYIEQLPEGSSLATIDDFHVSGSKKVGMEYFLQSVKKNKFYVKLITEHTTSRNIKKFIDHNQVWVLDKS